jgi:hypothetical protein
VIRTGIGPGDRVVIDGVQRTQGGKSVKTVAGQIVAEASPSATPDSGPPASSATPADAIR